MQFSSPEKKTVSREKCSSVHVQSCFDNPALKVYAATPNISRSKIRNEIKITKHNPFKSFFGHLECILHNAVRKILPKY